MTGVPAELTADAHTAAWGLASAYAGGRSDTSPTPGVIADAVLAVAHTYYTNRLFRQLHIRNGRCRWCSAILDHTHWGRKAPQPHAMSCRFYTGPLTHTWASSRLNTTLGGVDHFCRCGSSARTGGIGREDPPVCPAAHETHRTSVLDQGPAT